MAEDAFARRVTRLGALADPVRRALYRFVAEQPGAVSRDQAAEGVAVPRHTAKFHLERLVDEGLLVTEFRRLTGRSGPGAGRPAKLYRRSRRELAVSVPARRYDLAGQVLADAAERALAGAPMQDALAAATGAAAQVMVAEVSPEGEGLAAVAEVLGRLGYEPRLGRGPDHQHDHGLALRNCPYARLASDHGPLVCGMNEAFVTAVSAATGCGGRVERRAGGPSEGGCCVTVSSAP